LISLSFFVTNVYSQKTISGKSKPTRHKIDSEYKRGIPPNLFLNINFSDENNNQILEAKEKATLDLVLINKGKGPAQGLVVRVLDDLSDDELIISDGQKIPFIYPDQEVKVTVPIEAGFDIRSTKHKFTIHVT
jgi:hypothetical protein